MLITFDIFDQYIMNNETVDCPINHSSFDGWAELDTEKLVLTD